MVSDKFVKCLLATIFIGAVILSGGCELSTDERRIYEPSRAAHPVINEVFILPPDAAVSFAWVEIFNPTTEIIRWRQFVTIDSVTFRATSWHLKMLARTPATTGSVVTWDTTTVYVGSFQSHFTSVFDDTSLHLDPGAFLIFTNNRMTFLNHSQLGPGNGEVVEAPLVVRPDTLRTSVIVVNDTTFVAVYQPSPFPPQGYQFVQSGEIQLVRRIDTLRINPVNRIISVHFEREDPIDIVRYGNYLPATAIQPNNLSFGPIPGWHSLARFAGAHTTGNTREDFYIEATPTPLWHNQRPKR